MAKIKTSFSLELSSAQVLHDIASAHFQKNQSKALDWILRHMDTVEFARYMAKYHNSEFQRYRVLLEHEQTSLSGFEKTKQKVFAVAR